MGDWGKIREELAQMPPELARKIYDKMLADLTEKQKPNMRLDDVLGARRRGARRIHVRIKVHKLGQLLGLAVPANESYWLADRLKKGTDEARRHGPGEASARRTRAARRRLQGSRARLPPAARAGARRSPTKACATS